MTEYRKISFLLDTYEPTSVQLLWFCAVFPYVVLSILALKAFTLPGAVDGLKFLFMPDFAKLKEASVWIGKH